MTKDVCEVILECSRRGLRIESVHQLSILCFLLHESELKGDHDADQSSQESLLLRPDNLAIHL